MASRLSSLGFRGVFDSYSDPLDGIGLGVLTVILRFDRTLEEVR